MPLTAAICDDSPADRDFLSALASRWAALRGRTLRLTPFPSAESFLFALGDQPWDLLLLDIEMGKMDGVTMARQLRQVNDAVQIIFVTGHSQYIAEGYDVAALHYLLKPVSEEKLFAVLDRAAAAIQKNGQALVLEMPGETVRVPVHQIRYMEVRSNYVTIHAREDYTVKRPLKELACGLDGRFCRLGRSAVVNLRFVSRVTRTEVCLSTGESLPLPRGSYEAVNRAIINMEG